MILDEAAKWSVTVSLTLYIDDWVVSTVGSRRAVEFIHVWVSRLLISFIERGLGKDVAKDKLVLVASCRPVRTALGKLLGPLGFQSASVASLLGVDFAAGNRIWSRPMASKRASTARLRRPKLRWLRKKGADVHGVARAGLSAGLSYGGEVVGLRPAAREARRRLFGEASVLNPGGASLTAKLAVAGVDYKEWDPLVLDPAPAFKGLLFLLWHDRDRRVQLARSWGRIMGGIKAAPLRQLWRNIRGPVSAAWAELDYLEIQWISPFCLRVLDAEIDILAEAPFTTLSIIASHARRFLDRRLLRNLSEGQWDPAVVHEAYLNGIDWDLVRKALRNKEGVLTFLEARGLHLSIINGFWYESRWVEKGRMLAPAPCSVCLSEEGTRRHSIRDCIGVHTHLVWQRVASRTRRHGLDLEAQAWAPLALFGLPPLLHPWRPRPLSPADWSSLAGVGGVFFGDGSGVGQQGLVPIGAYALVRPDPMEPIPEAAGGPRRPTSSDLWVSSSLGGWSQTVPRAELSAAVSFLKVAARGATFVGDCRHVIDGLKGAVPLSLCKASSPNADLWCHAKAILDNRQGDHLQFQKVKAHRSRAAACLDGPGSLQIWDGNRLADFCAKQRAISLLPANPDSYDLRRDFSSAVQELAFASGWILAQGQDKVCDRGGVHASRGLGGGRVAALGNAGGHRFLSWRGGSACVQCWRLARTKASLQTIRNKRCLGCVADRVHASHRLQWTEGVWWCGLCGRFATTKPVRLLERCPGVPLSGSARRYLSAFLAGGVVPRRGYLRELAWHLGTDVGRAFCEVAVEAAFQRWFALGGGDGASLVVPSIPEGAPASSSVVARPRSALSGFRRHPGGFRSGLKTAPGYLRRAAGGYTLPAPLPRPVGLVGARPAQPAASGGIGALRGACSDGFCRTCHRLTRCICMASRQQRCLRCVRAGHECRGCVPSDR